LSRKGFTLIELLVVIVIIGILVAIALPNFIKIKDKAKEAEVKQNLHSIQLAVERYAVDEDGNYPFFLWGGTAEMNIGSVNAYNPPSRTGPFGPWGDDIVHPFDMFHLSTETWDYNDATWTEIEQGTVQSPFGDTLAFEGYMPKYPSNPFQQQKRAQTFGLAGLNISSSGGNFGQWACYGGRDGTSMWNIAYWGELPVCIEFPETEDSVQGDFPGNFYYHPRWSDGRTNRGHLEFQMPRNPESWVPTGAYQPPLSGGNGDSLQVTSLDVAGYDLSANGAKRTKGQDLDNSVASPDFPADHYFRTGYFTLGQERNPWVVEGGVYPDLGDYDERPFSDSVPDFYIIHLSSGIDKKISNPLDPSQ
jgi:general secretion pathway protein G